MPSRIGHKTFALRDFRRQAPLNRRIKSLGSPASDTAWRHLSRPTFSAARRSADSGRMGSYTLSHFEQSEPLRASLVSLLQICESRPLWSSAM